MEGKDTVVSACKLCSSAANQAEISFAAGEKQGRKEVVDWVEEQGYYSCLSPCECLTMNKIWLAKLKEWGIEKPSPGQIRKGTG